MAPSIRRFRDTNWLFTKHDKLIMDERSIEIFNVEVVRIGDGWTLIRLMLIVQSTFIFKVDVFILGLIFLGSFKCLFNRLRHCDSWLSRSNRLCSLTFESLLLCFFSSLLLLPVTFNNTLENSSPFLSLECFRVFLNINVLDLFLLCSCHGFFLAFGRARRLPSFNEWFIRFQILLPQRIFHTIVFGIWQKTIERWRLAIFLCQFLPDFVILTFVSRSLVFEFRFCIWMIGYRLLLVKEFKLGFFNWLLDLFLHSLGLPLGFLV